MTKSMTTVLLMFAFVLNANADKLETDEKARALEKQHRCHVQLQIGISESVEYVSESFSELRDSDAYKALKKRLTETIEANSRYTIVDNAELKIIADYSLMNADKAEALLFNLLIHSEYKPSFSQFYELPKVKIQGAVRASNSTTGSMLGPIRAYGIDYEGEIAFEESVLVAENDFVNKLNEFKPCE